MALGCSPERNLNLEGAPERSAQKIPSLSLFPLRRPGRLPRLRGRWCHSLPRVRKINRGRGAKGCPCGDITCRPSSGPTRARNGARRPGFRNVCPMRAAPEGGRSLRLHGESASQTALKPTAFMGHPQRRAGVAGCGRGRRLVGDAQRNSVQAGPSLSRSFSTSGRECRVKWGGITAPRHTPATCDFCCSSPHVATRLGVHHTCAVIQIDC